MLYPKAHKNIMFIIFATTSKGTIMEIRSTRSVNAIPATLFGVFLTCMYQICYVNYIVNIILIHILFFFLF